MIRPTVILLASAVLATSPVAAQLPDGRPLPDAVARHVIDVYNRPATIRLTGDTDVPPGAMLTGAVAVLGARFVVGGTVIGEVVVINGELHVEPGALIDGRVTVVGGALTGVRASVSGDVDVHAAPLRYRRDGLRIAQLPEPPVRRLRAGHDLGFGVLDFHVAGGRGYNRVEGLPLELGPRLRMGGAYPMVIEAFGVYRTAAGVRFEDGRLGYAARAERALDARGIVRAGARLYSEIDAIESGGLSQLENSLTTFVLHRDYRDHYERTGWSGYVIVAPPGSPYRGVLEYRDERHATVPDTQPWSLFDNQEPWRPQPRVAEGATRLLIGRLAYDTRNDPADPIDGWHVQGEIEQAVGGSLALPELVAGAGDAGSLPLLRRGTIDVRRYARLSPYARLAIRVATGGTLDGSVLPPQRQHVLGGPGSLPGYRAFSFDCGARTSLVAADDSAFFPYYGCDRMAIVQLEYQANFPHGRRLTEQLAPLQAIAQSVRWAAFFNAGRAWSDTGDGERVGGGDFSADAGLGLRIGSFGFYVAVPLFSSGDDMRFLMRLGPRF